MKETPLNIRITFFVSILAMITHLTTGWRLPFCLMIACALLLTTSCSSPSREFSMIPKTSFITHYEEESNPQPFLSLWENDKLKPPARMAPEARSTSSPDRLYIAPVTLNYLARNATTDYYSGDIEQLRAYFTNQLVAAFRAKTGPGTPCILVDKPSRHAYTLEVAILSVVPTPVSRHVLNNALDVVVAPAGLVLDHVESTGSIAMASRLRDPQGRSLIEIADYEPDRRGLLGDFKDFSHFAHHRREIRTWCRQMATLLTSPEGTKIMRASRWTLNPF